MGQVILQNKAQNALDYLKKFESKEFVKIIKSLKDIEAMGRGFEKLKPIGQNIKRMRVGRWRILCTPDGIDILVWIIAKEKDTQKDYDQRKQYILQHI